VQLLLHRVRAVEDHHHRRRPAARRDAQVALHRVAPVRHLERDRRRTEERRRARVGAHARLVERSACADLEEDHVLREIVGGRCGEVAACGSSGRPSSSASRPPCSCARPRLSHSSAHEVSPGCAQHALEVLGRHPALVNWSLAHAASAGQTHAAGSGSRSPASAAGCAADAARGIQTAALDLHHTSPSGLHGGSADP
jgi:hypothetical protein